MRALLILSALAFVFNASAGAVAQNGQSEPIMESRYTLLGECPLYAEGAPGYDWVLLRCEGYGGMPIWWRYSDSARLYIGFGERMHDSGFFGFDRDPEWPIEWRGRTIEDDFVPHAVIIRMPRPYYDGAGQPESGLFVFALRSDSTSCIVARDLLDNEEARSIADDAVALSDCPYEPYLYDGLLETAAQ